MPLMRIRSVEIVFEDEMSACTDTALLDRSLELILTDSDDSTKCLDDIEQVERECDENSVTLNADGDLSDDNSMSLAKDVNKEVTIIITTQTEHPDVYASSDVHGDDILSSVDDATSASLNVSDVADSGRFTEDACSSHLETVPLLQYEDALLSNSFETITVDNKTANVDENTNNHRIKETQAKLFEYIDSNSDSSDDTAVCEEDFSPAKNVSSLHDGTDTEDITVNDSTDLQYDSFIDLGHF